MEWTCKLIAKREVIAIFLSILLVFGFQEPLASWAITPTYTSIDPEKPQSFFLITSEKNEKPVPIEITIYHREIDEEGAESLTDASSDFLIYPSKVLLKPNSTKNIRLFWKGKSNELNEEKAYRLVATSLPVPIAPDDGEHEGEIGVNLSVITRYLNSVYVVPKTAKPNVGLIESSLAVDSDGHDVAVLVLFNSGQAHQYIPDLSFAGESADSKFRISKEMIKKAYPQGINILSNHKRILRIPLIGEAANEPLDATQGSL